MCGRAAIVVTRPYHTEALAVLHVDTVAVETVMLLKCRRDNDYTRYVQDHGTLYLYVLGHLLWYHLRRHPARSGYSFRRPENSLQGHLLHNTQGGE